MLKPSVDGLLAESFIAGRSAGGTPFAVAYKVGLSADWRVKQVSIYSLQDVHKHIRLVSDFAGHWFDADRNQIFQLDGCEFVDINLTPFTNTMPIKRLPLTQELTPVTTVFVDLPSFTVQKAQHFYGKGDDQTYTFQDVGTHTKATLLLDTDGLVQSYDGFFTQV